MKRKKASTQKLLDGILYLLFVVTAMFLLLQFVGQRTTVKGSSMEPALSQGDQILIDKLSYHFKEPERFDIVVFRKNEENFFYIKRIIGLPGEHIQISTEGDIYIDGRILEEYYGKERMTYQGLAETEIILGADEYFVLGDNRNASMDSRYEEVGAVKKSEIVGHAALRLYPMDAVGSLENQ